MGTTAARVGGVVWAAAAVCAALTRDSFLSRSRVVEGDRPMPVLVPPLPAPAPAPPLGLAMAAWPGPDADADAGEPDTAPAPVGGVARSGVRLRPGLSRRLLVLLGVSWSWRTATAGIGGGASFVARAVVEAWFARVDLARAARPPPGPGGAGGDARRYVSPRSTDRAGADSAVCARSSLRLNAAASGNTRYVCHAHTRASQSRAMHVC